MSFQVRIDFLGGSVFFQAGLCTPLPTMNTGYMQYKYTFLHNVFYKEIVSANSYVMVCVQTAKEAWTKLKIQDTLLSQKGSVQTKG